MPSPSLPTEELWVGGVACELSVDGGLQIDDAEEGTAFEASFVSAAKKPSTAFRHGALGVVKWKMAREPAEGDASATGCRPVPQPDRTREWRRWRAGY